MFYFKYSAIDSLGNKIRGKIHAANIILARTDLTTQGLRIVKLTRLWFRGTLTDLQLSIWCKAVGQFLGKGYSIERALTLSRGPSSCLLIQLQQGANIGTAIKNHANIFNATCLGIIESCHKAGRLDVGFEQAGQYYDLLHDLKKQIWSKMLYPCLLLVLLMGLVLYFMLYLVPSLNNLVLQSAGKPLFNVRTMTIVGICIMLGIICGGCMIFRKVKHSLQSIFNKILFTKVFSMLLEHSTNLIESITQAMRSAAMDSTDVVERLKQGMTLYQAMRASTVLDYTGLDIVENNEQTNSLTAGFNHIAEIYKQDFQARLARLIDLVQPALMIFVGVLFVALVYWVVLPIQSISF